MPQYLLAVYGDEATFDDLESQPEVIEKLYAKVEVFNQRLRDEGAWVFAGGLQRTSSATVVRAGEGAPLVTDGPYIESKERLGGFWIIEAADLDAALGWAKAGSTACEGPVEVRPFQEEPET